jgi:hypothetical protein
MRISLTAFQLEKPKHIRILPFFLGGKKRFVGNQRKNALGCAPGRKMEG